MMKDRLDEIFELQAKLDADIARKRGLDGIPLERWIQMQTLALMSELAEVIDEVNFKWWKNPKPLDPNALKEELADVLHFFVGMCLKAGLSPAELFDKYMQKNAENRLRMEGKSEKDGYAPL